MKRLLFTAFYKNKLAYLALALLLVLRCIQSLIIHQLPNLSSAEAYNYCTGSNVGAFILTPLAAFAAIRPASFLSEPHFAAGSGTRLTAGFRAVGTCFVLAAALGIVNSTTSALAGWAYHQSFTTAQQTLASTVLQILLYGIIIMIFALVLHLTGKVPLSFMACFLYGLWDFMAMNVVGGGIPYLSWGLVILNPNIEILSLAYRISFLLCLLISLSVALIFSYTQKEYLALHE